MGTHTKSPPHPIALGLLGLACQCLVPADASDAEPRESAALATRRAAMVQRQRRVIYNNDGCDIYAAGADTPAGFLARRMDATLGSQVDSVFYCTGATVMFSHDAQVGESYGRYPAEPDWAGSVNENTQALIAQGNDTLSLVTAFCHEHGLEVFHTHRINDIHDSLPSCGFELATWKREHPQYCLGRQADQGRYRGADPRYWWSALDFEIPEVRDYLLAIVEDICRRYDIDGYEVDYFRSPMFFKPNLDRKPATDEQRAILTDFQRRVRAIAYREGSRRGRPILVAVRVPMTVDRCRHVGIDIERWLADDLFDLLTTGGGYVPFTMPNRELVDLGHRHDKPVYPTISASGLRGRFRATPAWRGVAANIWSSGADGLVLFNTFPHGRDNPRFTQLGDPVALRDADKLFAIDNRRVVEGDLEQGVAQDQVLPVELSATRPAATVLPVGDDLAGASRLGRLEDLALHVRCSGLADGDEVTLRLNGRPVPRLEPERRAYTAPGRVGRAFTFRGTNVLSAGNHASLQVTDGDFSFALWVRTTQRQDWSGFVVFVAPAERTPGVKLYWNAGRPHISLRREGWTDWETGGGDTLIDGRWHHYAVTFDRDGQAIAYLDGRSIGTHDIRERQGSLGTNKTLLIGTGDVPFEGQIDDLRLYRRVLSADEIGRLMAAPAADPPLAAADLAGWWPFDEPSGLTFHDAGPHANDARPHVGDDADGWRYFAPDAASFKPGDNDLEFATSGSGGKVTNVELHVAYRKIRDAAHREGP